MRPARPPTSVHPEWSRVAPVRRRAVAPRVARARLIALLGTVAAALFAAPAAQARTPCPGEQLAPTAANAAQVSDAVFCLSNQIRAHYGLPAFRRDNRLDVAAALHSIDMGVRDFFDHTNPDGLDPTQRANAQGYPLGVGENIAYGYAGARAVVLGWMASAGHCRNLLGSAADLGVGTAVVGRPFYTQAFGDYFSRAVDQAPRDACPHTVNLDTLTAAPGATPHDYVPVRTQQAVPAAQAAAAPSGSPLSLRALSLSQRRFAARGRGTKISFRLSAPATVTFSVRRSGGRRTIARFERRGTKGANRLRFRAKVGRRVLRAGRYRLQAVARDASGRSTRVLQTTFVVTRR